MSKEKKLGFLGIVNEADERAKALASLRQQVPAPDNCSEALSALNELNAQVANLVQQTSLQGDDRPKERLKYALATLITEYTDYYNSQNCAANDVLSGAIVPSQTASSTDQQSGSVSTQPAATTSPVATTVSGSGLSKWVVYAGLGVLAITALIIFFRRPSE